MAAPKRRRRRAPSGSVGNHTLPVEDIIADNLVLSKANGEPGESAYTWGGPKKDEEEPGPSPCWEKVLWKRQPFPDNYIPPSFLQELVRWLNGGPRAY